MHKSANSFDYIIIYITTDKEFYTTSIDYEELMKLLIQNIPANCNKAYVGME